MFIKGIFPITKRESEVLHDLGWQSGFGWKDEWDWWPQDAPHSETDNPTVRARLVEHITMIRAFADRADKAAIAAIHIPHPSA